MFLGWTWYLISHLWNHTFSTENLSIIPETNSPLQPASLLRLCRWIREIKTVDNSCFLFFFFSFYYLLYLSIFIFLSGQFVFMWISLTVDECSLRLISANAEGSGFVNDKNQRMKWMGQNASGFLAPCVCERSFSHTSMRMRAHTYFVLFVIIYTIIWWNCL